VTIGAIVFGENLQTMTRVTIAVEDTLFNGELVRIHTLTGGVISFRWIAALYWIAWDQLGTAQFDDKAEQQRYKGQESNLEQNKNTEIKDTNSQIQKNPNFQKIYRFKLQKTCLNSQKIKF